nr:unnamed protein product [Callosobruchus chinensis]
MWFTCVTVGTIATIVVIMNLWEKFQTNPTITGLDTDFHNWDVPFPAITLCQEVPTDADKINSYLEMMYGRNDSSPEEIQMYMDIARITLPTLNEFFTIYRKDEYRALGDMDMKTLVYNITFNCTEMFSSCTFKSLQKDCCEMFVPTFTEYGICFVFNSQHHLRRILDIEYPDAEIQNIQETDPDWAVRFVVRNTNTPIWIYITSSDELASTDTQPHHVWDFNVEEVMFSVKETYTTADTAQLSIKQRRCAFDDDIKLAGYTDYSYTLCTRQCRMNNVLRLCKCLPYFYPSHKRPCDFKELTCVVEKLDEILNLDHCNCYLGCSNTVYEVEKLDALGTGREDIWRSTLTLKFVSWPMVKYKREVLFGWVDLLVSFGGIAGLFLGFSLLSGVEIVYYFTIRAFFMLLVEKDELRKMKKEKSMKPMPAYDLSLTPYFISKPLPGYGIDEVLKNYKQSEKMGKQMILGRRRLKPPSDVMIPPFGIEFMN